MDSALLYFFGDAELHARVAIIAKMCNRAYQLLDRMLGLDDKELPLEDWIGLAYI